MNTIPASEIKRRGISAVDQALEEGPVHVIRHNRPSYVVMKEEDYQRLTGQQPPQASSVWDWLEQPSRSTRSRQEIDAQLRQERDAWDR